MGILRIAAILAALSVATVSSGAPIHDAARDGDLDALREAVDAGIGMDARDEFDATPLHWAVVSEQPDLVGWLIDRGASINVVAMDGKMPLHLAALTGNLEIATLLIENGAQVNPEDLDGMTPLNYARGYGHETVVQLLLAHGGEERPVCITRDDIEDMNEGALRPLFVLQGRDARIFLALDPRLTGELEVIFEELMDQEIDEIVAWRLTGRYTSGLATAVPFNEGCAVEGYGEPDMREKISAMRDATRLIGRRGVDDAGVRESVRALWEDERPITMSDAELEAQVDEQLRRLRAVLGSR